MNSAEESRLLLTASDVARLAGVRRPVVSVWRRRHGASAVHPFPSAVDELNGVEVFDAHQIAEWLVESRHGNNPDARDDVAAFATSAGASHRTDDEVFAAVTAALCLAVVSGESLGELDRDALLDLADECDPDDVLLYSELSRLGDRVCDAVRYAELRTDATLGPAAAFEDLLRERGRALPRSPEASPLRAEAYALVARIAVGLAANGEGTATYATPAIGSQELLMAVVAEHGELGAVEVLVPRSSHPDVRMARRRLRVHDVVTGPVDIGPDGSFVAGPDVVHVLDLSRGRRDPGADLSALDSIDQILLQMDDTQRGVVIGPAAALSDRFGDEVEAVRAGLLRTGRVKAIARLPRGLVRDGSRQTLALWVVGSAEPAVPAADRVTWLADLANLPLSGMVIEDLASDLLAVASGDGRALRARAHAYARPIRTTALLAASASLVEAGPARVRAAGSPDSVPTQLAQAYKAVGTLAAPDLPRLTERPAPPERRRTAAIGELVKRRWLGVVPGTRYERGHLDARGGYPVIGPEELLGLREVGERRIDPLVHGTYPSARLTEPGDVIFCASPRASAYVDHEGTSVVLAPARVLRVRSAAEGLSPHVIAADIGAQPEGAREWRRWPVRSVAAADVTVLGDTLTAVRQARRLAEERLRQLDEIEDLIIEGVAAGTLSPGDGAPPPSAPLEEGI